MVDLSERTDQLALSLPPPCLLLVLYIGSERTLYLSKNFRQAGRSETHADGEFNNVSSFFSVFRTVCTYNIAGFPFCTMHPLPLKFGNIECKKLWGKLFKLNVEE